MNDTENLKFTSARELSKYLKKEFEGEFLTLEAESVNGGTIEIQVPRYLFIGEPGNPKRLETLHNAVQNVIPNNFLKEIQKTTSLIESRLRQFLQTTPTLSTAYLGYYGFLSDFLYLTSSVDATIHGIFGKYVSNNFNRADALIACIDISELINDSLIIDLTDHTKASLTRAFNIWAFHNPMFLQNLNKGFFNVQQVKSYQLSFQPDELQTYAEEFKSPFLETPDPIAVFLWNTLLSLGYKMSDSSARFIAFNKNLPLYDLAPSGKDAKGLLTGKFAENENGMREFLYRKLSILHSY